jgi:hypothetical protein
MPTNIRMKDDKVITIGIDEDPTREIYDVIEEYCGYDFLRYVKENDVLLGIIHELENDISDLTNDLEYRVRLQEDLNWENSQLKEVLFNIHNTLISCDSGDLKDAISDLLNNIDV